jgi:hypothetical protein
VHKPVFEGNELAVTDTVVVMVVTTVEAWVPAPDVVPVSSSQSALFVIGTPNE